MTGAKQLVAPFPWYGGKRKVAPIVWQAFGEVRSYVEPFFGSGAVLLGRPGPILGSETVNDADAYLVNFWRAVKADPEGVAKAADWPVSEIDLHARHAKLIEARGVMREIMRADPDWFDVQAAGWWVWGLCQWIGHGWAEKASKQIPFIQAKVKGQGVHSDIDTRGVLQTLSERLRRVRIVSGDWTRVASRSACMPTGGAAAPSSSFISAVFLDPPYDGTESVYGESEPVSKAVGAWCRAHGSNSKLRIALTGYAGEHDLPGWVEVPWKRGNTSNRGTADLERLWLSPACLPVNLEPVK